MNILKNLPLIIFSILFLFVILIFLYSLIIKSFKKDSEKAKEIFFYGVIGLVIILLISLVFYIITLVLKNGEVFRPKVIPGSSGEFPMSQAVNFPPAFYYMKLTDYYFMDLYTLKNALKVNNPAVYAVLCKKSDNYDIISIGDTYKGAISKDKQYNCWLNNCKKEDIYFTFFWLTSQKNKDIKDQVLSTIINQLNPVCIENTNGQ